MSDLTKLMNEELASKEADYNFCLNRKQYALLMGIVKRERNFLSTYVEIVTSNGSPRQSIQHAKKSLKRVKRLIKRLKV